jgi:two-component system, sensor histidine kinase RegB
MTLAARELQDQLGNDPDFGPDIALLNEQAVRCRAILAGIAQRTHADQPLPKVAVDSLLLELMKPHESAHLQVAISNDMDRARPMPALPRTPEITHGLSNLIANAARHARTLVGARLSADREDLVLLITDDGPGFPPDILPRLGEPNPLGGEQQSPHGLGLGIFIATTLLDRTGAKLAFSNAEAGGARVEVRWRNALRVTI